MKDPKVKLKEIFNPTPTLEELKAIECGEAIYKGYLKGYSYTDQVHYHGKYFETIHPPFDTELRLAIANGIDLRMKLQLEAATKAAKQQEKIRRVTVAHSSQSKWPLIIAIIIGLILLFSFWHLLAPPGGYENIEPRWRPD